MYVLRIEHKVPSYDGWRKAFDSDPIGREKSGVRRYRVMRSADDPNYVLIDLEFDNEPAAKETLTSLRALWGQVEGKIMIGAQTRIAEIVDAKEY